MPFTPSCHDDGTAAVIGLLHHRHGGVGELALYVATVLVDGLELGGETGRLVRIVGDEQVKRHVDVTHATRSVKARDEGEGQAARLDLGEVAASGRGERNQADALGVTHERDALRDEGTVLAREGHHVRDGAERRHVRVLAPEVRPAKAAAQLVNELEGDAGAGKVAAGTAMVELGITDGNALGHEVSGLVMVRHDDVDPLGAHHLDFDRGGDAIVDRDDEIGVAALDHALERLGGKAVALAEAPGNVGVHLGAKVTKRERKEAGRAHAVHVEVAKDGNGLAIAHGSLDAVGRGGQAGKLERVMPVPVKRRGEELLGALGIANAARHHDARHER